MVFLLFIFKDYKSAVLNLRGCKTCTTSNFLKPFGFPVPPTFLRVYLFIIHYLYILIKLNTYHYYI
jgi:hypothetical protein